MPRKDACMMAEFFENSADFMMAEIHGEKFQRCEIHPGPRFMLRRYHVRDGHFSLIRYYYQDPWCTVISYSVLAVGSFFPSPEKATSSSISWVVPGGMELDFTMKKVLLMPFTQQAAKDLSEKVNSSCPSFVSTPWKSHKKYKVLGYDRYKGRNHDVNGRLITEFDCTNSLDLNFNELLLTRLEHRIPLRFLYPKSYASIRGEFSRRHSSYLFLGVEGTRRGKRPTYYQEPLLLVQTEQCPVCLSLSKSNISSPPSLSIPYDSLPLASGLEGQWISLRCEVRPYGLFLRRTFIFGGDNQFWKAQHSYFKDPQCQNPMFTLSAKGTYFPGPLSKLIEDAIEYDFHITETYLTPDDDQFANNLNGLRKCGSGATWSVGYKGNLTISGGCRELGIVVPSVEEDLVRFEKISPDMVYLYLGETPDDKTRPTSFQPPLVRCSTPDSITEEDYLFNYNELHPLPLISRSLREQANYLLCFVFVTIFHLNLKLFVS